jgi:hypothetical protein
MKYYPISETALLFGSFTDSARLFFHKESVEKSTEHWRSDTDKIKLKYSDGNLYQCHFAHHKSHVDRPRIKPVSPRCEAGD